MSRVPAVVLVGGLGTRLPEVSATRPKPMADIYGKPFLDYLLAHLRRHGIRDVILCGGYKAEVLESHYRDGRPVGLRVRCIREPEPAGTGGALRFALPYVAERAVVLNGDTFIDVDLSAMLSRHVEHGATATIAAVEHADATRFGRLRVDGDRVVGFEEKRPGGGAGLINAGVYVLERGMLAGIPSGKPVSLEREVLPYALTAPGAVRVFRHNGYFEDIGVPESLAAFRERVRRDQMETNLKILDQIRAELRESVDVKSRFSPELIEGVHSFAKEVASALRCGGKVVFFGNGGSAADAQHLAGEFVGRFRCERAAYRALALSTNTSIVTALANDYDYGYVFERQIEAWVEPGDVAVGISTSGNSECIVRGLRRAKERGAFTVAMTGEGGGKCSSDCDLLLGVPSRSTPRIQESHITIGHIMCGLVESMLLRED